MFMIDHLRYVSFSNTIRLLWSKNIVSFVARNVVFPIFFHVQMVPVIKIPSLILILVQIVIPYHLQSIYIIVVEIIMSEIPIVLPMVSC